MRITIKDILNIEPNDFKGLTKFTFLTDTNGDDQVYGFRKPENPMRENDILDGTIAPDRRGTLKFSPTPSGGYGGAPQSAAQPSLGAPDFTKLEEAVDRLTVAVNALRQAYTGSGQQEAQKRAPEPEAVAEFMGGELVDDL